MLSCFAILLANVITLKFAFILGCSSGRSDFPLVDARIKTKSHISQRRGITKQSNLASNTVSLLPFYFFFFHVKSLWCYRNIKDFWSAGFPSTLSGVLFLHCKAVCYTSTFSLWKQRILYF